jgi:hypothetical protein
MSYHRVNFFGGIDNFHITMSIVGFVINAKNILWSHVVKVAIVVCQTMGRGALPRATANFYYGRRLISLFKE